jgi:hypothetical protein
MTNLKRRVEVLEKAQLTILERTWGELVDAYTAINTQVMTLGDPLSFPRMAASAEAGDWSDYETVVIAEWAAGRIPDAMVRRLEDAALAVSDLYKRAPQMWDAWFDAPRERS